MKKNMLKSILFFVLLGFCFKGFAQVVSKQNSNTTLTYMGVELNEYSQDFYNQTGFVRCLTSEMEKKSENQNSGASKQQRFEDWLAPLLQEYKQNKAAQKAAGTFEQATYNIPIIFHVIYNNEVEGFGPNLSQALVDAQIDQLNIDFSNLAGATSGPWSSVSADSDIQFVPAAIDPTGAPLAQPGINRVGGYATPLDFDGVIKPATIWDRTKYANVWTGDLGGGLLGYAQFPDNSTLPGMPGGAGGAVNTDGVVCGYGTIGSVAIPHPNGGQFALGRTLTHEIGHWIGLRHIWGDGGCNVDDFCADTPIMGGANNGGCATANNSCPAVTFPLDRDMPENYMDYSSDSCMNIFTQDQVDRMIVVLQNSPGRTELPNSNTGNAGPSISVAQSTTSQNEGSDCSFTDVVIDLVIGAGPSNNANVSITATDQTATAGTDFELLTDSVTFTAGISISQSIILRIFNDSVFEGDETFVVDLSVNANGGDATIGNGQLVFTINDDDVNPSAGGAPIEIFADDFETGLANWTVTGNGSPSFSIKNNATYTDAGFFATDGSNTTNYVAVNDDGDCGAMAPGCNYSNERIALASSLDLTSYSSVFVSVDYVHDNQYVAGEYAALEVSTDGGTNWTELTVLSPVDAAPSSAFQNLLFDAAAYAGLSDVRFSLYYTDDGGWGQGLIIDNFSVKTPDASNVQTITNTGVSEDQVQILGTGISDAFDTVSNDIMLSIDDSDNTNYACTTVSVSRDGTSGQPFNGSVAPALVMDKTFTIAPGTVNNTGTTTLSFYVTEAELTGWETATGDTRTNLNIAQEDGGSLEVVASTISPFGSNYKVSGNFTSGIRGTYYFGNTALLSTSNFNFEDFSLYPNPVSDQLNISFTTSMDVNVGLYDIRGREVSFNFFKSSGSIFNTTLDMTSVSAGIYVIKIVSGENTMIRKIIVK